MSHTRVAVLRKISRDLASAHGESDQRDLLEIELPKHFVEIRREGVVVVAGAGLARTTEAATVVGDHAMAGRHESCRLLLP